MNGNRIPSIILWPTVPLAIGAAVFLTEYRPHWGLSLDAIFLSAGVLLLVRAAFIRRVYKNVNQDQKTSSDYEASFLEKDEIQSTRFGVALIVAALAGLLSLIPTGAGQQNVPPPDQIQSLVQLLGKTESDLNECAKSKGCKPDEEAAAARMERVLIAFQDIVRSFPRQSPPQNGTSPGGTIVIVAIVIAIVAIIWLTVKSSPSKTPLAITAALVGAIIKGAELLPRPGGDFYWYSIFVLLGVGGLVVLIAVVAWVWRGPVPAASAAPVVPGAQPPESFWSRFLDFLFEKPPERPDSNSPMVIGFSILLIAFAMAYLGKAHEQPPTTAPQRPCPACPVSTLKPMNKAWPPVRGFGEKNDVAVTSDLALGEFKRELELEKFTDTDLVLLLGATDCTPINKNSKSGVATNQALAVRRADFVKAQASKFGLSSLPAIVASAVPQAESCGKTLNQRAVYPLLFRTEAPK